MKINKLLFRIAFLLAINYSHAQITLSGHLNDDFTGEPLSDAFIYFPELRKGTVSEEGGDYKIENLKKGSYLLEINKTGYKTFIKQIDLNENTVLDFSLEKLVTELDNVVITGVARLSGLKKTPLILTTRDNTWLNRNNSTNLIEGLESVPGISNISTGPNISKPIIRGLGYNRVITLNNGLRQEGQQWGDEHGIEIDEYSVNRVEIIKGPGSLMYGSDAIAGVLNFLPPRALSDGQIKAQIMINYQNNNNFIGTSASNSGNLNGVQWQGRVSNKLAGNYQNKFDGKVFNSGFKELNADLALGVNKNWGHSFLRLSSFNSKIGIVEGERDEDGNFVFENSLGELVTATPVELSGYKIVIPYQRINHLSLASNNYFILNKGSVNADFGFQNNRRREFEEAQKPDEAGLWLSLNTLTYNVRYNFEKLAGWEVSPGLSGMWQTNRNKGAEFLIPDYNLLDAGAFVFVQKTLGQLSLAGGLRFDNRNLNTRQLYLNGDGEPVTEPDENSELKFSHFKRNYNGFSGSIGMAYQLNNISTLKFNLSQGFRAPNIAELASNGVHEGTFRYEIGNPDLKSEISRQIDLAYFIDSKHITLEITPFVNFIRHFSFLKKLKDADGNDVIPDISNPVAAFMYTSGRATLSGGEINFDFHPHPLDWLHIENSFSYVRGIQNKQKDSMRYLPLIPAAHYRGGLRAELKNMNKLVSNSFASIEVDHYFAQNRVLSAYDTEMPTPAYTLISAGIGANLDLFGKKDFVNLLISVNNLTNAGYQSHLSRLKYAAENQVTGRTGVFNMGRNLGFKMIMNL